MKVALIPLKYNELNYGGLLQFYALQKTVEAIGYEFDILKVDAERLVCPSRVSPKIRFKRFVKRMLNVFLNKKTQSGIWEQKIAQRAKVMDEFEKKFFGEFAELNATDISSYDAVICGSDQIWNPTCAKERTFLKFVPEKINKVIYAASFGCDELTQEQKAIYKPLIERLEHVSVRELSGKPLIESFVSRSDIEVVLDPTLLLNKEEWEKLTHPVEYKNYMFTYFLGKCEQHVEYLKDFAKKNSLTIVNIISENFSDGIEFGDINLYAASPHEFLSLIKNADIVFSDSFHACVFATIFNKKFYVFKRKNGERMIGRIETLLKNFGLPARIVNDWSKVSLSSSIDYLDFQQKQNVLAEKSISFLKKSVTNGKQ